MDGNLQDLPFSPVTALLAIMLLVPAMALAGEYRLWRVDGLTKVTPATQPSATSAAAPVEVALARREAEGFQLAIRCDAAELRNVRVDSKGFPLPIEWHLVGYIKTKKEPHPDMLLPVERFNLPQAQTCAIYVTVRTDADTPAGHYRHAITVLADDAEPVKVELDVTVFDFVLPLGPGECKTAFALQVGRKAWKPGEYRQYADFMLAHRLNPDDIYRLTPPAVEDLEYFLERGMNYFTIRKVAKGWSNAPILQFHEQLEKSKHAEQLKGMAYVYGYDERPAAHWDAMGECFAEIKQALPHVKTFTTAHVYMDWPDAVERMKQYHIDAVAPWIHPGYPLYYRYDEGVAVRKAGLELWGYNINFQTHMPLIQSRATFWQMYHQQCDGWLYYCVNGWAKDAEPIDPAQGPFVDYESSSSFSQGEFLYQGKDGPIGSLRLTNIRDGIEDWHYLHLLARKLGDVEAARQMCEQVSQGVLKWTDDPNKLYDTRRAIAERLAQP